MTDYRFGNRIEAPARDDLNAALARAIAAEAERDKWLAECKLCGEAVNAEEVARFAAVVAERDALRVALAEVLPLVGSAVSDLRREARERHHSWWTQRAQNAAAALDRARALLAGKGSTK